MKKNKHSQVMRASLNYELEEVIGQGAQGCVYRAQRFDEESQLKQIVAIKVLNSEKSVPIWQAEFQSLNSVNSKRCVSVLGFERFNGRPALILEYIHGVNLEELLSSGEITETEISWLGQEIFIGLEDLHREGLKHGDLSPRNIMISSRGEVKILDFGLGNQTDGRRFTKEFAAPELLFGEAPTEQTDLVSLKLLLNWARTKAIADRLSNSIAPQESIAHIVIQMLNRRKKLSTQTYEISAKKPDLRSSGSKLLRALGALVILNIGFASEGKIVGPAMAAVSLRSNFGLTIVWDDRELGHIPIDLTSVVPGKHILRWKSHHQNGQRTLTLKAGEHIVLNDDFFKN